MTGRKIVAYTEGARRGGAEVALRHLLAALDASIAVTVMGPDRSTVEWVASARAGADVVVVPPIRSGRRVRGLLAVRRAIAREAPAIFQANLAAVDACLLPLLAASTVRGVRTMSWTHSPIAARGRRASVAAGLVARGLSRRLAVGGRLVERIEAMPYVRDGSVTLVPVGIPSRRSAPVVTDIDRPLIGSIARLVPGKRLDLLVRAAAEVGAGSLVVVGDGPEAASLAEVATTCGIRDRVHLVGWQDDPSAWLAAFDVFVLPSDDEGVPITVIEAMHAGIPVIATDVGSVRDVVVPDVTGVLVAPGDAHALAVAIGSLLADPEQRAALAAAGSQLAVDRFSVEAVAARFEALYRDLGLARRPNRAGADRLSAAGRERVYAPPAGGGSVTTEECADVVVVGGGIVGLATALALSDERPDLVITLVEKETAVAMHQTGRNSGVIHSGVYYEPGSMKARLCAAGRASMVRFCEEHGIAHRIAGKLVVATHGDELERLDRLYDRAVANGLDLERLGPSGLRDHEPEVDGIAGFRVASTGVVDFGEVARTMAGLLVDRGVKLRLGERVERLERGPSHVVGTDRGELLARFIVNCAGLHSDRVARQAGLDPEVRIVPFRGEYYELVPDRRHLVNALIYPVPDPSFPFLGVHLTKGIDGSVHLGPNAVPSLAREGYDKRDVVWRDVREAYGYSGFRRLARRHARSGAAEIMRSLSPRSFVASVQRLVPAVQLTDVVPAPAGVRAQALRADGGLVDDFLLVPGPSSLHVCNAPSPAATSSLEIGKVVAAHVLPVLT